MFLITKNCSKYGHPEFAIECCDSVPEQDVWDFISYLEDSVRKGKVYKNGDTFTVGWMLAMIFEVQAGVLGILEPDMKSLPIEWVVGITETLRHFRIQKETVKSVMSLNFLDMPSIEENVYVGIDCEDDSMPLFLERADHKDGHSGWLVGKLDSQLDYSVVDNRHDLLLYTIAIELPFVIKYLALPPGTRVESSPGKIQISLNGTLLPIKPRSYLDIVARSIEDYR